MLVMTSTFRLADGSLVSGIQPILKVNTYAVVRSRTGTQSRTLDHVMRVDQVLGVGHQPRGMMHGNVAISETAVHPGVAQESVPVWEQPDNTHIRRHDNITPSDRTHPMPTCGERWTVNLLRSPLHRNSIPLNRK